MSCFVTTAGCFFTPKGWFMIHVMKNVSNKLWKTPHFHQLSQIIITVSISVSIRQWSYSVSIPPCCHTRHCVSVSCEYFAWPQPTVCLYPTSTSAWTVYLPGSGCLASLTTSSVCSFTVPLPVIELNSVFCGTNATTHSPASQSSSPRLPRTLWRDFAGVLNCILCCLLALFCIGWVVTVNTILNCFWSPLCCFWVLIPLVTLSDVFYKNTVTNQVNPGQCCWCW